MDLGSTMDAGKKRVMIRQKEPEKKVLFEHSKDGWAATRKEKTGSIPHSN